MNWFYLNFVWILFLIQIFHLYIRCELIFCQIDIINQCEIKKTIWNIDMIKFVSIYLKKKATTIVKRMTSIQNNVEFEIIHHWKTFSSLRLSRLLCSRVSRTTKNSTNRINPFWKKKDFQRNWKFENATFRNFAFACYNYNNLNHFKNKCWQFIRKKKISSR